MYRQRMIIKIVTQRQQGMTLVELMFAVGVLAFVLSMIFTSVITVGFNQEIHTQRLLAESVVNEVLDQISRTGKDQILNFRPNVSQLPGVNAQLQVSVVLADGTNIPLPVTNSGNINLPNPVEVRVQLTWQTPSRGYTLTKRSSTYVSE